MNREQYMEELERLLIDIPEEEREEVLDFYEDYFDDAGEENEQQVIWKLGTPEKLALSIKYNLKESNDEYAEYTEYGYEDTRTREEGKMPDKYTEVGYSRVKRSGTSENSGGRTAEDDVKRSENRKAGGNAKLILFIILMVFLSPVLKGLVNGLLVGIVVAIAVAVGLPVLGIIVAGAITLALGAAGIALAVTAIPLLFTNIAVGILLIGLALFFMAAVFVGVMVIRWIAVSILPKYIRRFTETCRRLWEKCTTFFRRSKKGGAGV